MSTQAKAPAAGVDYEGLSPVHLAKKSIRQLATAGAPPRSRIIDASVHVRPRAGELRRYMSELWQHRRLPQGERYYYPNHLGDYLKESYVEGGPPGSDPEVLARHLFKEAGISEAILLPLTLGLFSDLDLLAAICSATNSWLADTWLSKYNAEGRYKGTIRVAPGNPVAAVSEIEKWAGHPHFVQIGVPLQSMQLYGTRFFLPVWEAAAKHRLPVVFHLDAESGVELAPTTLGYMRHYLAYATYQPVTFMNHLTSFMVGGVLDHLPDLKLVFADGGYDMCAPLTWRLDKDYRPTRGETPWMKRMPSDYIRQHVRFIAHALEGPDDPAMLQEWLEMSDAGHILMYGSNYPNWDMLHPNAAFPAVTMRQRILSETAAELYNLPEAQAPNARHALRRMEKQP